MLSANRRRQILDDDPEEARFDMKAPGDASAPENGQAAPREEDGWVNNFMGRLAALVRDVGGREK
ncbi:hypothetical protein [Bradyrhizobium sp. dw_411]|uniref:hypothetical protein n=1 Tax=Bradyrhizobium sp. dw_411 TaxID=2720082 RepID=UPI001BCF42AA|nr:hypothetical protein [Bradyrhizobium sp. dw_411]